MSLRLFRSCSASLSPRALRHSTTLPSRYTRVTSRQYSQDKDAQSSQADSSDSAATDVPPLSPEAAKLAAKETEVIDLKSRLQYLQADFLNLQRNSAREKEQARDFAMTRFAGDLLEVADVLALAMKSVPNSILPSSENADEPVPPSTDPSLKSPTAYLGELHTGVDMTHRLLLQVLFKYHIKPFDPLGDPFDPNRHEALYQAPIPGKTPGSIIDVQKVGYTIKDRVLRAAQVGVAQDT